MGCVVDMLGAKAVELIDVFVCRVVLAEDVMEGELEVVGVLVCELDALDLSSSSSSLSSSSSPSSLFSKPEYQSMCLSQMSSVDDIFSQIRSDQIELW